MLRLHGFSSSNYYNVVKLTLLEKQLPFEEARVYPSAGPRYRPDYLQMSPQGKVPCLETERGCISESRAICAYLEDAFPEHPLYPREPFERAKVLEQVMTLDLYFDLPARRVLRNFFGGKKPPEAVAADVRDALRRGAESFSHLVQPRPWLGGERFGAADVSAAMHLPIARMVAKQTLDFDPLEGMPGIEDYLARVEARPTVQRIRRDQAADLPGFIAHIRATYAAG
jgi:glutathione S-transferase